MYVLQCHCHRPFFRALSRSLDYSLNSSVFSLASSSDPPPLKLGADSAGKGMPTAGSHCCGCSETDTARPQLGPGAGGGERASRTTPSLLHSETET